MSKFFLIIIITLFINNCSLNNVVKRHGVQNLEKKSQKIILNQTNKNDIFSLLGPPSTYSIDSIETLIYIERSTSSSKLRKLGGKTLLTNNVLIVELDGRGLATNKKFLDKEDMNEMDFSKRKTAINYGNKDFVYDFLSSVRKKINDPLGKKGAMD